MDPIALILSFALQNPGATADVVEGYHKPGQIETARLRESLADFSMQTLRCYHKSARFRGVTVLGGPWNQQASFGAENSVILRIYLQGISGTAYQMDVAAMVRGKVIERSC